MTQKARHESCRAPRFLQGDFWPGITSAWLVIRELTKPFLLLYKALPRGFWTVSVKRTKNLLDSQCVGCVYARSAMRGKECSTDPRQAESQDSDGDYSGIRGFHLKELRFYEPA